MGIEKKGVFSALTQKNKKEYLLLLDEFSNYLEKNFRKNVKNNKIAYEYVKMFKDIFNSNDKTILKRKFKHIHEQDLHNFSNVFNKIINNLSDKINEFNETVLKENNYHLTVDDQMVINLKKNSKQDNKKENEILMHSKNFYNLIIYCLFPFKKNNEINNIDILNLRLYLAFLLFIIIPTTSDLFIKNFINIYYDLGYITLKQYTLFLEELGGITFYIKNILYALIISILAILPFKLIGKTNTKIEILIFSFNLYLFLFVAIMLIFKNYLNIYTFSIWLIYSTISFLKIVNINFLKKTLSLSLSFILIMTYNYILLNKII